MGGQNIHVNSNAHGVTIANPEPLPELFLLLLAIITSFFNDSSTKFGVTGCKSRYMFEEIFYFIQKAAI
jgi:hypothetical protein